MPPYKQKHPTASQEDFHDAEFDLDFKFPQDYCHYALNDNGGRLISSISREPDACILFGLGTKGITVLAETQRLQEVWRFPHEAIAIASDSFGYTFCFRNGHEGIWHWDRETGDFASVSPSFAAFYEAISREDGDES